MAVRVRDAGPLRAHDREFEYGTALYNDSLRRVYDTNFVRFERGFDELTGDVVEAAADELQASLRHRKVLIPDERAGARVAEELKEPRLAPPHARDDGLPRTARARSR